MRTEANVDLSIGTLVLGGVAFGQRHRIAAAVEQELQRLLIEGGIPRSWQVAGSAAGSGAGGGRHHAGDGSPEIGRRIAQAVYATDPGRRG